LGGRKGEVDDNQYEGLCCSFRGNIFSCCSFSPPEAFQSLVYCCRHDHHPICAFLSRPARINRLFRLGLLASRKGGPRRSIVVRDRKRHKQRFRCTGVPEKVEAPFYRFHISRHHGSMKRIVRIPLTVGSRHPIVPLSASCHLTRRCSGPKQPFSFTLGAVRSWARVPGFADRKRWAAKADCATKPSL